MAGCVWKYVGAVVIYGKYYQHSERKRRRRARKGLGGGEEHWEERRGGELKLDDMAGRVDREKDGGRRQEIEMRDDDCCNLSHD